MTDIVKKFEVATETLNQQGAKVRAFNKGAEVLNVADIFRNKFGLTFGGNEN